MIVKLKKISPKPFVLLSAAIYSIAGLVLGLLFGIASVVAPNEPDVPNLGFWSILIFPIVNAIIGAFSAWLVCLLYNVLSAPLGGLEFEVEETQK